MAINKVIDRNGNTLIDLTNDTIKPNKVLEGVEFHGPDGHTYVGAIPANEIDALKYTFYDYDGTLLYSYTDEELDALDVLPSGGDHTEDNLTFEGWNWTLEDLKAWDRTRPDRPIVGAHYITTDGITYITLISDVDASTQEALTFSYKNSGNYPKFYLDWGDGSEITEQTIQSTSKVLSHTYPATNTKYTIKITPIENMDNLMLGFSSSYGASGRYGGYGVIDIKLGNIGYMGVRSKLEYAYNVKKINIPSNIELGKDGDAILMYAGINFLTFPNIKTENYYLNLTNVISLKNLSLPKVLSKIDLSYANSLRKLVIPDTTTVIRRIQYCKSLREIIIPSSVMTLETSGCLSSNNSLERVIFLGNTAITALPNSCFTSQENIVSFTIPSGITTIGNSAFNSCYNLFYVSIPDSVTSIGSNSFTSYVREFDLSQQTKLISLTSDIGLGTSNIIIKVPSALLDQYKSASYWSKYASRMVGV